MDKKQAIKVMAEGKRVQHVGWKEGEFITLTDSGVFLNEILRQYNIVFGPRDGWEIYEEPKAKEPKEIEDAFKNLDELLGMVFGVDVRKLKPEEPKSMTKLEAIRAMTSGAKVTNKYWLTGCYIYMTEYGKMLNEYNEHFTMNDSHPDGWVIYEEPVKQAEEPKAPADIHKELIDFLSSEVSKPNIAELNFGFKVGDSLCGGTITKIEDGIVFVETTIQPEITPKEMVININFEMPTSEDLKTITLEKWLCKLEGADGYEIVTASDEYFENVAAVIGVQRVKKLGEETIEIEGVENV